MTGDDNRLPTTHAGSLPRPASLRELLAAGFSGDGEGADAEELAEACAAATRAAVARQLETGLDIVNNGEQGRESFFTYVQHRMSGFGGASKRAVMRDTTAFPGYRERMVRASRGEHAVNLLAAPRAVGEVRYTRPEPLRAECADPTRVLAGTDCGFETSSGVSFVAADVAWAKLASLREGAAIASRKLFG